MKRLISSLLMLSGMLLAASVRSQVLEQEGPCLYGIKVEGECNPAPVSLSEKAESSGQGAWEDKIVRPDDEEICFCGIAEPGVCNDSCEELKLAEEREEEAPASFSAFPEEDAICFYGVASPGECRAR